MFNFNSISTFFLVALVMGLKLVGKISHFCLMFSKSNMMVQIIHISYKESKHQALYNFKAGCI